MKLSDVTIGMTAGFSVDGKNYIGKVVSTSTRPNSKEVMTDFIKIDTGAEGEWDVGAKRVLGVVHG